VGNILYAPTGPDNYGYFAYDIHDSPLMPEYNWVEVNPEHGGAGTVIPFTADDQTVQVDLPFTFTYYGQDYTQISVCTNGWIAMGYTTSNDWSNSTIPNPDGPPSMIAPFWDDLSPQVIGDVVYYYDATDHYFVVEFDSVRQYTPTTAFESFEVILYDPSYYQTITGDGEILMQWARVSDPSSCTIGFENQTKTDGIQYLYNTTYDVHATPIEAEMAVLYTTGREIPDVTITLTPQSLPIIIPAIGGSFQYTLAIANSGTIISYFDAWTDALLPDSSLYGPILLRSNLSLAPGGTISRNMTQSVPGTAPAGDYIYYGKVGNNPVVIFDSDSFPFTKLAGDGVNSNYGEWTVSGWDEQPGFSTAVPESYFLSQNYPNPFNPETSISFGIPQNGKVSLKVYNLLGEVVATLIEGQLTAGYYEFKWNASGMSSGIYFYRLNAPGYTMTRKMMLIR
jgi:hypothetical protein